MAALELVPTGGAAPVGTQFIVYPWSTSGADFITPVPENGALLTPTISATLSVMLLKEQIAGEFEDDFFITEAEVAEMRRRGCKNVRVICNNNTDTPYPLHGFTRIGPIEQYDDNWEFAAGVTGSVMDVPLYFTSFRFNVRSGSPDPIALPEAGSRALAILGY